MHRKIFIAAIALVSFFTVTASPAYAFLGFFERPDAVIKDASLNLLAHTALKQHGDVSFTSREGSGALVFDGVSDISDLKEPKFDISVQLTGISNISNARLATSTVRGSLRLLDETLYIRLDQIPPISGFNLKSIEQVWVRIPNVSLSRAHTDSARRAENEKLKEALLRDQVFNITSDVSSGLFLHHYTYELNKPGLKKLLADRALAPEAHLTAADIERKIAQIKTLRGDVWVSRWGRQIERLTVHGEFTNVSKHDVILDGDISLGFPSEVVITAPTESRTLSEVFSSLFGGSIKLNVGH